MVVSRIVLFRPGALGDTLLTFPTLALLRRARPQAQLIFVARGDVLPLARSSGLADAVYSYDLPAWSALFALNRADAVAYPLAREVVAGAEVVAWLGDPAGTVAANLYALGARRVVVAPGRPAAGDRTHMALQLARALHPCEIPVPNDVETLNALVGPIQPAPDDVRQAAARWAALGLRENDRVVALHPGSGGAAKRWAPSAFAALAETIASWGLSPLLIEGPQDDALCDAVQAACGARLPVARELTLGTLAALLRRCAGYVGADSGVSHLAGMAGTPALALFGPTDPVVWAPLGPRVLTLRSPSSSMADLPMDAVAEALRELIDPRAD